MGNSPRTLGGAGIADACYDARTSRLPLAVGANAVGPGLWASVHVRGPWGRDASRRSGSSFPFLLEGRARSAGVGSRRHPGASLSYAAQTCPGWRSWFRLERSFPNLAPQGASESPAAHKPPGAFCHPGRAPKPRRSGALGTGVHAHLRQYTHTVGHQGVHCAPHSDTTSGGKQVLPQDSLFPDPKQHDRPAV